MATILKVGPVTRIEGHLDIEVTLNPVGGVQTVTSAKSSGTMFRGFETILRGRDPRDATHYTQRICGVCPVSHGMASVMALEKALKVTPPANGRILRNLVLGADFIMSHVMHFYHLNAPDYIDTTGLLDMSPWTPRFKTPDMITGATAAALVQRYVQALAIRRKAHQMGAIFGGKMPISPAFVPGGITEKATTDGIAAFRTLLTEIRAFVSGPYMQDVYALASAFQPYYNIGKGCGNLLAFGVFDEDNSGNRLLKRGRLTAGVLGSVDTNQIREFVRYSWYSSSNTNRNPSVGQTTPTAEKSGAYSWIKAPRYAGKVHEVGPLARMWVTGEYRNGISVMDRIVARALETRMIADAMEVWLGQLDPSKPSYTHKATPGSATGIGLTEAPRGALGHWLSISESKISAYQLLPPTSWNASPRDDAGVPGAIEQALVGAKVADSANPVELLRIVHSFDPCLSCSVHVLDAGRTVARIDTGIG